MKRLMRTLVVVCTLTVVLASPLKAQRREGDSGAGTREQLSRASLQQIEELLSEKHSRSKAQQKVDSQLLFAGRARQGKPLTPHIQSLETSVETDEAGFTVVDITANIDDDFLTRLRAQGAHVLYSYPQYRSVRALVALESVETIAAMPQVIWIQPKQEAMTSRPASFDTGSASDDLPGGDFASRAARVRKQVTDALPLFTVHSNEQGNAGTGVGSRSSEGDAAHEANRARGTFGVTGAGIKIGVLSDGVTNLATSQALGDLGPVTVLSGQTGSGDEGTAMLEIVHDLAPGAQLYFATAFNGIASFADNIRALRAAGCDIIVDDVFYYAETPFQDGQTASVISTTNGGTVIQAVNDVTSSGALYFSSAGNSGNLNDATAGVWEGDFLNSGTLLTVNGIQYQLHSFSGFTYNALVALNTSAPVSLYWSDPLGGSSNDYDLFRLTTAGVVTAVSTNIQSGTQDPYEQVNQVATTPRIVIAKKVLAQSRFLHLNANRGRFTYNTTGQTHGHASAANAYGCAATPAGAVFPGAFSVANSVETFSSDGPRRIFYQANGVPYTAGNVSATGGTVRQKPDITAADGVAVTGVGGFSNPFFGTSAAAPHGAAIAGLIKSKNPALLPAQIRTALTATALDIEAFGPDRDSGAGIIMPFPAMQSLGFSGGPNVDVSSVSATEDPGNGNGSIEAGEGAKLVVILKNNGVAEAPNTSGTLATTTAGVILASPATQPYGTLAVNGSASPAVPFRFALQPGVPCPLVIEFTLTVQSPALTAPRVLSFSVRTGLSGSSISTTFGTAPPAGNGFTSSTGSQTARLFRDGVASTCGTPKSAFPGVFGTGTRRYEAYAFKTCPNSGSSCVKITLAGANAINLLATAYLDSFNPANVATNYIADAGSSSSSRTFEAIVPSGRTLIVVVAEVNAGGGTNTAYTITADGCITASCPVPNQLPVARVKNVTVAAGPSCSAAASVDDGSSDPEGNPLTFTQSPAGPYALGTTAVLFTVTDSRGAFAQAVASVTVIDATAPVLTAPANLIVNNRPGQCAVTVNAGTATATDNCGTTVVSVAGVPAGNLFPVGATTLIWTATDAAGNTSTAQQTITVKDVQPPVITPPADITANNTPGQCGATVNTGTATATDNCGTTAITVAGMPAGNLFPVGATTLVWTATDAAGNTSTAQQTITVKDAQPPLLTPPANMTVNNATGQCAATVNAGTATATDNCGTAVISVAGMPAGNLFPVGATTLVWTATDAAGNTSSAQQIITVKDAESPSLTVPAPITTEFANADGIAVSFETSSSDNCAVATHTCLPASGATFGIGVTTVSCTATDLAGNATSKTFTVTVLGARGTKTDVLAELKVLRATVTDKQDGATLDRAIADLQQSLDSALWIDQTHLQPSTGDRAFQAEKDCVTQLGNLLRKTGLTTLQGWIDRIVKSDRLLATVAISDAGSPPLAMSLRTAGDEAAANGQSEAAIEHYRNSWSQALKGH